MSHSVLAPSASSIWGACPGSVTLSLLVPDRGVTAASLEGSEAHERAEARVLDFLLSKHVDRHWEGQSSEMYEAGTVYLDKIKQISQDLGGVDGGAVFGVEDRVECPSIHQVCYGTVDFFAYSRRLNKLYVVDFKYGHGFVPAFENPQLITYASGLMGRLGIDGELDQLTSVELVVVQPRSYDPCGPVRTWALRASELRGHVNKLSRAAELALSGSAECKTGPHCKYCPARGSTCVASVKAGYELFEAASSATHSRADSSDLSVQFSLVQRARKHLEALESGLSEEVKHRAGQGELLPGYTLEETQSNLKWKLSVDEVIALGVSNGVELGKKNVVTPTQAIKLGIDESVIMAYSERTKTGGKLVPDNGNQAKKVFSK